MTKRQFFVIAFRVIAVYLFLALIGNLSSFLVTVRRTAALEEMSAVFVVGIVGLLIVAFLFAVWLLWKKSEWMMERILAVPILQDTDDDERKAESDGEIIYDPYDSPLTANSITQIIFVAIGLKTVLGTLPDFLHQIDFLFFPESGGTTLDLMIPDFLMLAIGLWLFLRRSGSNCFRN